MKTKFRSTIRMITSLLALLMALAAMLPTQVAFAQGEEPPTQTDAEGKWGRGLEWAYQRELQALERQQKRLENTAAVASKVESLIERAQQNGRDVTALQKALDDYLAGVADAQAEHDQAAAILEAHAGFDENGKVTDPKAARKTIIEASNSLRQAHRILEQTTRALHREIRLWIKDQRPTRNQE